MFLESKQPILFVNNYVILSIFIDVEFLSEKEARKGKFKQEAFILVLKLQEVQTGNMATKMAE